MSYRRIHAWTLVLGALLSACQSGQKSILFTTKTSLGIELSTIEANKQGVALGYERFAGVVMPVVKEGEAEEPSQLLDEAYSVLALHDMDTGSFAFTGLGKLKITQVFATGEAAVSAEAPEAVANTFRALRDDIPSEEVIVTGSAIRASVAAVADDDTAALERIYGVLNSGTFRPYWTQVDGEGVQAESIKSKEDARAAVVQIANRAPQLLNELSAQIEIAKQPQEPR
jgi:hypothetical protein